MFCEGKILSSKSLEKIQVVDLARSIAIMTVMALHLKPSLPLPPPLFRWGWDHFQRNGEYGVCMFFVISGFLITRIIDMGQGRLFQPSWKLFYARRVGRIIPLFLLAVALGLFLFWVFNDDSKKFIYCFKLPQDPTTSSFWIPLFTFTFNWANGTNWGGVGIHWILFWSLAVEEQFYFFYPLTLKYLGNVKRLVWFLISIVILGLLWRWGVYLSSNDNIHSSMRISFGAFDQIAIGALLYLVFKFKGEFFSKNKGISSIVMSAGLLIILLTYLNTFPIGVPLDRIFGPTLIATGLFLFLLGGLHLSFFENKWLKLFSLPGKFSYGNYLFHISVLFFVHSFLWNLNIVIAFLVFVFITTSISALSYQCFEVPSNKLIRKWLGAEPINGSK